MDLNTCGGTHASRLGEIGLVHLVGVERLRILREELLVLPERLLRLADLAPEVARAAQRARRVLALRQVHREGVERLRPLGRAPGRGEDRADAESRVVHDRIVRVLRDDLLEADHRAVRVPDAGAVLGVAESLDERVAALLGVLLDEEDAVERVVH